MISLIYAYRNRDLQRIKASLDSLVHQTNQDFEVIFVDYGSELNLANQMKALVRSYSFASYYYLPTQKKLWNKSIALNYGIKKATKPYIFIADVDLVFHPSTVAFLNNLVNKKTISLFELNYLSKEESEKIYIGKALASVNIKHAGTVNGMVLAPKEAFFEVHGYDEFFHFYGSEDVDLIERMKHAGYSVKTQLGKFFYHLHHPIYNGYDDATLSQTPRLYNAKRLNLEQLKYHKLNKSIVPFNPQNWGEVVVEEQVHKLTQPDVEVVIETYQAEIVHFLEVKLPNYKNRIVSLTVQDKPDSFKIKIKKMLGMRVLPKLTLKECNDLILSKIIYTYRNDNYSYQVAEDLKSINFRIQR